MADFRLIGVDHNNRHSCDNIQSFFEFSLQGVLIGKVVVGIERQNAPAHFIHNIFRGSFDNHILNKISGKRASLGQNHFEKFQLFSVGEAAKQ